MGFRRKFRRPFRRRSSFRRPVARVRRTWVTSLVPTVCQPLEVALQDCGELNQSSSQARFVLMTNSLLQSKFSDRARVVRIVGDLWISITWDDTVPSTCEAQLFAYLSAYAQAFMGLRRYEKNAAGFALTVDPLGSDTDYSEAQWLRTWQHAWLPVNRLNTVPSHTVKNCTAVICTDTHTTGAPDNIFTDGTGTIDIETDCLEPNIIECNAVQDSFCEVSASSPQPWHQRFDMKKRIPLREDQELALELETMFPAAVSLVNPRLQIFGGIKCLVEF